MTMMVALSVKSGRNNGRTAFTRGKMVALLLLLLLGELLTCIIHLWQFSQVSQKQSHFHRYTVLISVVCLIGIDSLKTLDIDFQSWVRSGKSSARVARTFDPQL